MKKGRVLVVDDEYGIRSGVHQILEMEGYEVEEAETGEEGLAGLDEGPSISLIDYRLPDIDGLTLSRPSASGSGHDDLHDHGLRQYRNGDRRHPPGNRFFLPKPFSPEDLIGVMETLIRHKPLGGGRTAEKGP